MVADLQDVEEMSEGHTTLELLFSSGAVPALPGVAIPGEQHDDDEADEQGAASTAAPQKQKRKQEGKAEEQTVRNTVAPDDLQRASEKEKRVLLRNLRQLAIQIRGKRMALDKVSSQIEKAPKALAVKWSLHEAQENVRNDLAELRAEQVSLKTQLQAMERPVNLCDEAILGSSSSSAEDAGEGPVFDEQLPERREHAVKSRSECAPEDATAHTQAKKMRGSHVDGSTTAAGSDKYVSYVVMNRKPGEEWGLCLDDDTMVLCDFVADSPAARSQVLRSSVGMLLERVNNLKVYFPQDVERLTRGDWVALHFYDRSRHAKVPVNPDVQQQEEVQQGVSLDEEQRRCKEVVVELVREAGQLKYPWGLVFGEHRMLLNSCPMGIAARSEKARACIGMRICKVNGNVVHNLDDVQKFTDMCLSLTLHFQAAQPVAPSVVRGEDQRSSELHPATTRSRDSTRESQQEQEGRHELREKLSKEIHETEQTLHRLRQAPIDEWRVCEPPYPDQAQRIQDKVAVGNAKLTSLHKELAKNERQEQLATQIRDAGETLRDLQSAPIVQLRVTHPDEAKGMERQIVAVLAQLSSLRAQWAAEARPIPMAINDESAGAEGWKTMAQKSKGLSDQRAIRARGDNVDVPEHCTMVLLACPPGMEWVPWGFRVDETSMTLVGCSAGSIAAGSTRMRGCTGMQLWKVNDSVVSLPQDVFAVACGQCMIQLYFHHVAPACPHQRPVRR